MRFRQEVLNLFNSALPFLNENAQKIINSTQHFAELLQSPTGLVAINSFHDLKSKTPAGATGRGTESLVYNPYSLFLVFYLLILASDPKSLATEELPKDLGTPSILPMSAGKEVKMETKERISENPI